MPLLLDFARNPPGTLREIQRRQGDLAFFRFGPYPEVLVSHPDLVEQVLVTRQRDFSKGRALNEARRVLGDGLLTSEGATHLARRRLIQPLFTNRVIDTYGRDMVAATRRHVDAWAPGARIDVHAEMMRLTLGIVARTVFDVDLDDDADRFGRALDTVLRVMSARMAHPLGAAMYRLPLPTTIRFNRASAHMDRTIAAMIAARRRSGVHGGDLLSRLLASGADGDALTERDVRDEAMTLLLAGHETTAVWLSWTLMLLDTHRWWETAIVDEISAEVGGRPLVPDDLPRLPILDRVLREALRLYPPVWLIGRRALRDVPIGDRVVPRDTIAVVSQWVVHRDHRWFPEAERFEPNRWSEAHTAGLPRFAFFPFGGGVRRCIGEGFARMEAGLVLGTILQRVHLTGTGRPVRPRARITLRPASALRMTVTPRR